METRDFTPAGSHPPLVVRIGKQSGGRREHRFLADFKLGRVADCDIQFTEMVVSGHHAEIIRQDEQWWIRDLGSKNGTYLDGQRIQKAVLPHICKVQLGHNGPVIELELMQPDETLPLREPSLRGSVSMIANHYFGSAETEKAGANTRMIRQAFQKVQKKHKKKYWTIIVIFGAMLVVTAAALYYQSRRVQRLEQLHALAEEIFYSMKSLELQVAKLEAGVAKTTDPKLKKEFEEKRQQTKLLQTRYTDFARDELGISRDRLSEEEWLIYKVARIFGECDVNMPKGFVAKIREYIKSWQTSPRMQNAMARARERKYAATISRIMTSNDMPPQFFYLALQESNFDLEACGPMTRSGIAKGMWQFMPETAWKYGLRTGPLLDVRRADPFDERHDVRKSTVAAARYLRDLYETEAQASGLLVMACYNWREDKILDIVRRMPEDPRERNFWSLLAKAIVPNETYDYVFYIFSAAVIGENPRLFGFDFDSPLRIDDSKPDGTSSLSQDVTQNTNFVVGFPAPELAEERHVPAPKM
jgi:membrane-bound lytic murein transglycosylase D